jgi:hypothetical protein
LPVGAFSSHTWRGRDETGREALLREVPEGTTPFLNSSTAPGIVPLRDVVSIEGRRYGVWDLLAAESLQEIVERLLDAGGVVPLGFVIPATLCGMGVALAFDARPGLKSATICGTIALVFWVVFSVWLGVGLGPAVRWPL